MKLALLILVLAAACGKAAPIDADCTQAATKSIELFKAKTLADAEKKTGEKLDETMKRVTWALMATEAGLPIEPEKQVEFLAGKCIERGDSQAKRNCMSRANNVDELNRCDAVK